MEAPKAQSATKRTKKKKEKKDCDAPPIKPDMFRSLRAFSSIVVSRNLVEMKAGKLLKLFVIACCAVVVIKLVIQPYFESQDLKRSRRAGQSAKTLGADLCVVSAFKTSRIRSSSNFAFIQP